jgi:uncharacterized membrane protein
MSRKSTLRFVGTELGFFALLAIGTCGVVAAAAWTYVAMRGEYQRRVIEDERERDIREALDAAVQTVDEVMKEARGK